MSIQPNRVLARIIEPVELSDWPPLDFELRYSKDGGEWIRSFTAVADARYATPFHFWVHALRDELQSRSCEADLMGVAGYALCHRLSLAEWQAEVRGVWEEGDGHSGDAMMYRMQESTCRRSSVARIEDRLFAYFWGHGPSESWRREGFKS